MKRLTSKTKKAVIDLLLKTSIKRILDEKNNIKTG
jgi:hypothetical protein